MINICNSDTEYGKAPKTQVLPSFQCKLEKKQFLGYLPASCLNMATSRGRLCILLMILLSGATAQGSSISTKDNEYCPLKLGNSTVVTKFGDIRSIPSDWYVHRCSELAPISR